MKWTPLGSSVIGASHKKKNIVNQDSISISKEEPVTVAVSDGHGAKKYIRSHQGSHLATEAIIKVVKEALPLHNKMPDIDGAIRHIKNRFLIQWQEDVESLLETSPFSEEELKFLEENITEKDFRLLKENPRLAFGCTFLCAIAYQENLVLIMYHGDGDVMGLYNNKVKELSTYDSRNFAGGTLSLGSLKDASEIGHQILTGDDIPNLITISTDGIKNSYNDTVPEEIEQFYKIPVAIKTGLEKGKNIRQALETLLETITENGSGDDVTLGVMYK